MNPIRRAVYFSFFFLRRFVQRRNSTISNLNGSNGAIPTTGTALRTTFQFKYYVNSVLDELDEYQINLVRPA